MWFRKINELLRLLGLRLDLRFVIFPPKNPFITLSGPPGNTGKRSFSLTFFPCKTDRVFIIVFFENIGIRCALG